MPTPSLRVKTYLKGKNYKNMLESKSAVIYKEQITRTANFLYIERM